MRFVKFKLNAYCQVFSLLKMHYIIIVVGLVQPGLSLPIAASRTVVKAW
jgi:hypothetical protein